MTSTLFVLQGARFLLFHLNSFMFFSLVATMPIGFLKRSGRLVFQAIPSYHLHYQIMDGIDERTSRGLPFYFDECHCVLGTTVVPEKHGQIDSGDIIHNSSCK